MPKREIAVSRLRDMPVIDFAKLKIKYLAKPRHMSKVSVVHVKLPPRYEHVALCHKRTHEWLMILKGSGQGKIDGRVVRFKPGTILYMAPGVLHQMGTKSSPLEALVVFSPPLNIKSKNPDICYPRGAHTH